MIHGNNLICDNYIIENNGIINDGNDNLATTVVDYFFCKRGIGIINYEWNEFDDIISIHDLLILGFFTIT